MSNWLFWISVAINIFMAILVVFTNRTVQNLSDMLHSRKKEYEAEKGKNLATKEDITEITKKIEEVKNSVAFSSQKKYEQKMEQERLLVSILRDANLVALSQSKLMYCQYDTTSRERLDNLVDSVNDIMARFAYECNLAGAFVDVEDVNVVIRRLEDAVSAYGIEICVDATNSATFISQIIESADNARTSGQSHEVVAAWLNSNKQAKEQLEQLQGKPLENKDKLQKAIATYRLWLKNLYGRDFFMPSEVHTTNDNGTL